jgi:hypothetical protein
METVVVEPRNRRLTPSTPVNITKDVKKSAKPISRSEAKELLGEYAFSLIDAAIKAGGDNLYAVLEHLDEKNISTEDFEDAVLAFLIKESISSPSVSREEVMKALGR